MESFLTKSSFICRNLEIKVEIIAVVVEGEDRVHFTTLSNEKLHYNRVIESFPFTNQIITLQKILINKILPKIFTLYSIIKGTMTG